MINGKQENPWENGGLMGFIVGFIINHPEKPGASHRHLLDIIGPSQAWRWPQSTILGYYGATDRTTGMCSDPWGQLQFFVATKWPPPVFLIAW